ncbi:uncharacterized protein LOC127735749 [Mytilus californianus]|uniref:uncharacterized protein LOC127735749 n=1 Tax=Mytilus californianus TaxID=6549 RepID=UPI0022465C98|nr:uncharacterized protein LOC127735749 [Mytilus californianus]
MNRFIALVLLPAFVLGCCPPKQWRGMVFVDYSMRGADGMGHRTEMSEGLIYDQTARKLVTNQTLSVDGGPEFYQVALLDYNTGMEYIVRDNKCTTMNITTMEPGCIPTNATVVKQSYIGAGAAMVKTTMYRFVEGQMLVYLTVADDGCVPVIYESAGMNSKGESVKMGIQYLGIEAVASDASVFNLPASCSMS